MHREALLLLKATVIHLIKVEENGGWGEGKERAKRGIARKTYWERTWWSHCARAHTILRQTGEWTRVTQRTSTNAWLVVHCRMLVINDDMRTVSDVAFATFAKAKSNKAHNHRKSRSGKSTAGPGIIWEFRCMMNQLEFESEYTCDNSSTWSYQPAESQSYQYCWENPKWEVIPAH